MDQKMVKELLLQALEHERGGVKIYQTALKCVVNEDLQEEWERYEQETETHVQILQDVCTALHLDPEEQTPGRKIVHDMGGGYIAAMEAALGTGDKEMAPRAPSSRERACARRRRRRAAAFKSPRRQPLSLDFRLAPLMA